jgi:hypothetical protein
MKKWQILSVAIAASIALAAKPALAILGPMPVIDVGPEQAVWNNQLIQQGLTRSTRRRRRSTRIRRLRSRTHYRPASDGRSRDAASR